MQLYILKSLRVTVSSASEAFSAVEPGRYPKPLARRPSSGVFFAPFLSLAKCCDHNTHGSTSKDQDTVSPTPTFPLSGGPAQCHRQALNTGFTANSSFLGRARKAAPCIRQLCQKQKPEKAQSDWHVVIYCFLSSLFSWINCLYLLSFLSAVYLKMYFKV